MLTRENGRLLSDLRTHEIIPHFVKTADGSCLIRTGETRVICTASVEEKVPPFLRGKGEGWVTAEYAMLPASTGRRKQRDGLKKDGRSVEISRLIGRALRQAVNRKWLGERSITVDCDVLTADGGTRTAAITGGFVALCYAIEGLMKKGLLKESPITHHIAAVSAGIVQGQPCLDLCYSEDSTADVDMNFIMNDQEKFVELQGTGEEQPFSIDELHQLLGLGQKGCRELIQLQKEALGDFANQIGQKHTLVLATNNAHKVHELTAMLGDHFHVLSMKEAGFTDEIEENGATFEENALIKAQTIANATGFTALADDSGLSVDALNGAPGIYSARYAGEHGNDKKNNELLIEHLKGLPTPWTAQFVCALALVRPSATPIIVRGEAKGEIIAQAKGEGGFGYDPHFLYKTGETFATMSQEDKNAISHRANAMEKLMKEISSSL